MKRIMNYQKELDEFLSRIKDDGATYRLLLHSCCAPCSSRVLEYLSGYFDITVFYYNPNIFPEAEYEKRVLEQKRLLKEMPLAGKISFLMGKYDRERFYETVKGLEDEKEGGARCLKCYELRLNETAKAAKEGGFDFFTTTLSVSPLKDARKINDAGDKAAAVYGVPFLRGDFKKKDGYKRSVELSNIYGLYRQDYCGCEFSLRERRMRRENATAPD